MRRLMLLAVALSALLCTNTAPIEPGTIDHVVTMGGVAPCGVTQHSHAPGNSDAHWRPQHHASASVTESVWKSAFVHAELATVRSTLVCDSAPATGPPAPAPHVTPHYLRHTPLLI